MTDKNQNDLILFPSAIELKDPNPKGIIPSLNLFKATIPRFSIVGRAITAGKSSMLLCNLAAKSLITITGCTPDRECFFLIF